VHLLIQFRKRGAAAAWDTLGRFKCDKSTMSALRELLAHREDPLEALEEIKATNMLVYDSLQILQADGCEVCLIFED
jgi:hypothetical protein